MTHQLFLPVFISILIMVGASTSAWASHLGVSIDSDDESSPFHAEYQKTVFIVHPEDGLIHDQLSGQYPDLRFGVHFA